MENHEMESPKPPQHASHHSPPRHTVSKHTEVTTNGRWHIKLGWQLCIISCITGIAYWRIQQDILLAIVVTVLTAILGWMLALLIKKAGEYTIIFATMRKNEYMVSEVGGMLQKYHGEAERWVEADGEITTPEHRSASATLEIFTPHPKTGKILRGKARGLSSWFDRYLINTFGVTLIGLPGIVSIKRFELQFSTLEHEKVKHKSFVGDKAVTTIFDSYSYLFRAGSLNTVSRSGSVPMFVEVTILFFVDNLHTPSYMALPAGKWISLAHEEFTAIARAHVAQIDYATFFQEKIPDYDTLDPETREKHEQGLVKDVVKNSVEASLEELILAAGDKFVDVCGHRPYNVLILDIDFEGNTALKEANVKKAIAQENAKSNLITAQSQTRLEQEYTLQAVEKRKQKLEISMADIEAQDTYIKNIFKAIKNKSDHTVSEVLSTVRTRNISEMPNLNVLGGEAATIISPSGKQQKKKEGGDE